MAGSYGSANSRLFNDAFGAPEVALTAFRRAGVKCIELSHFQEDIPASVIMAAVDAVWTAGLQVSVHPFIPVRIKQGNLASLYPWLYPLAEKMPEWQERIIFVLHAVSSVDGSFNECFRRTVTVLREMIRYVEKEHLPVRLALEINRAKGAVDPSVTYTGVVDMCREIASSSLGICWDWGHSYANILNRGMTPEPPETFVRGVIHNHIHDVGPKGDTHWPLTQNIVPVKDFISPLRTADFSGWYVLELYGQLVVVVIEKFILCGDYSRGVARIQCTNPDCKFEYFRPFSCKSFYLCPSCAQKRTLLFSEYMHERLLLNLPHRQFVWTVPRILRHTHTMTNVKRFFFPDPP